MRRIDILCTKYIPKWIVWLIILNVNHATNKTLCYIVLGCECVFAMLFVLCVSVLHCDGPATCSGCTPPLARWLLEKAPLRPLKGSSIDNGWMDVFPLISVLFADYVDFQYIFVVSLSSALFTLLGQLHIFLNILYVTSYSLKNLTCFHYILLSQKCDLVRLL